MPGTPGAGWNDDEVLDWKQRQLILSCIEVAAVRKKLFVIMEVKTTTVDCENGGSRVKYQADWLRIGIVKSQTTTIPDTVINAYNDDGDSNDCFQLSGVELEAALRWVVGRVENAR